MDYEGVSYPCLLLTLIRRWRSSKSYSCRHAQRYRCTKQTTWIKVDRRGMSRLPLRWRACWIHQQGPPATGVALTPWWKAKHMERRGSSPSRSYVPGFKLLDVFGPMVKLLRMKWTALMPLCCSWVSAVWSHPYLISHKLQNGLFGDNRW